MTGLTSTAPNGTIVLMHRKMIVSHRRVSHTCAGVSPRAFTLTRSICTRMLEQRMAMSPLAGPTSSRSVTCVMLRHVVMRLIHGDLRFPLTGCRLCRRQREREPCSDLRRHKLALHSVCGQHPDHPVPKRVDGRLGSARTERRRACCRH